MHGSNHTHKIAEIKGDDTRLKQVQKVTWVGTFVDLILTSGKLVVGFITQSSGLIADGIHSLSDLVTDVFILFINKIADEDPDDDHPYGHARFETLGTVVLGMVLFSVGIGLAVEYGSQLLSQESKAQPSFMALAVIILALAAKEWLFHYTMKWAKKTKSALLEANAWHSRSDALSSVVVLLGVIATLLGYPMIETLAAIAVAALICHMGFKLTWGAIQDLADRGVDPHTRDNMIDTINEVPGAVGVHYLRSRLMGSQVYLDLHLQVNKHVSVSEGHQVGDWVMKEIKTEYPDVVDITLHIDYENDDVMGPRKLAPLRHEIMKVLQDTDYLSDPDDMLVHYHNQKVKLELKFIADKNWPALYVEADQLISSNDWLDKIELSRIITR